MMMLFIPRGRVTLCLDRTEWKFGQCEVNVLMLTARCGEVAVPLFWELLDNKSGNSAVTDRVSLLDKAINLLGIERIGLLVADREFVGANWVRHLKKGQIPFCLRLPKTHPVRVRNGEVWFIEELLLAKSERFYEQVLVDGQWLNVHLKRLKDNEFLYLVGTFAAKQLGVLYRQRWSIEALFQCLKKRGFDIEATHLQSLDKLKKLIGLVSIAYGFCLVAGHHYHRKVKAIASKSHGYKSNGYFRKGKDKLEEWLADRPMALWTEWLASLDRAYRWLELQLTYFQRYTKIFR